MFKIISLLLVLFLAFLSWWFQDDWKKPLLLPLPKDKHFIDYFMDDFSITKMNAQGQISHTLHAKHMQHYNDSGDIQIDMPVIKFQQDNINWQISALRAETQDGSSTIYFFDNVQIERNNDQQQVDFSMFTDYLKFNSQNRIAQTDHDTHIITPDMELNAKSMLMDYHQGILKLNSQVKARYARRHFPHH